MRFTPSLPSLFPSYAIPLPATEDYHSYVSTSETKVQKSLDIPGLACNLVTIS